MTRARAAIIILVIVIATAAAIVPGIRDDAAWVWAESRDHAADYKTYMRERPKGRHFAEAKLKYDQREWIENKKAAINRAYQEAAHPDAATDAEYDREKMLRRDSFFWKRATNLNTADAYVVYLQQFPNGQFVRQARAQLDALNHPGPQ